MNMLMRLSVVSKICRHNIYYLILPGTYHIYIYQVGDIRAEIDLLEMRAKYNEDKYQSIATKSTH